MAKLIPPELNGVFAALATPFATDGTPSLTALDSLVDFGLEKGLTGFCLAGATGEYPACSVDQRLEIFQRVAARVKGKVRLVCAIGAEHSGQVQQLARAAVDCGAIALLLPPPIFLPYSQADLADFIAQVAADLPLPVLLYNIPQCTRDLGLENVLRLIATVPNIIGLKDSSGQRANLAAFKAVMAREPMAFFVGSDDLIFDGFEHGATGSISGIACGCPDLILPLVQALQAGDKALARTLQDHLNEYIRHISGIYSPWATKLTLQAQGIDPGTLAWPMGSALREKVQKFQDWFAGWLESLTRQPIGTSGQ